MSDEKWQNNERESEMEMEVFWEGERIGDRCNERRLFVGKQKSLCTCGFTRFNGRACVWKSLHLSYTNGPSVYKML